MDRPSPSKHDHVQSCCNRFARAGLLWGLFSTRRSNAPKKAWTGSSLPGDVTVLFGSALTMLDDGGECTMCVLGICQRGCCTMAQQVYDTRALLLQTSDCCI